jgi:hypothetical protein
MKHFAKHLPHYFALIGIFAAGIIAFLVFSYDRLFQAAVAISIAVAYVVWGIVHHAMHKDLYFSVVIEYLVVALLGLVLIFSLVLRT